MKNTVSEKSARPRAKPQRSLAAPFAVRGSVGRILSPNRAISAARSSSRGASMPATAASHHHNSMFRGIEALVVLLNAHRSLGITQLADALQLSKSTTHDL